MGSCCQLKLFPTDAKGYADRMKQFLKERDDFVRWDIVEFTDHTVMAFLRFLRCGTCYGRNRKRSRRIERYFRGLL